MAHDLSTFLSSCNELEDRQQGFIVAQELELSIQQHKMLQERNKGLVKCFNLVYQVTKSPSIIRYNLFCNKVLNIKY